MRLTRPFVLLLLLLGSGSCRLGRLHRTCAALPSSRPSLCGVDVLGVRFVQWLWAARNRCVLPHRVASLFQQAIYLVRSSTFIYGT